MNVGANVWESRIIARIVMDCAQENTERACAALTAHEPEDFGDERNRLIFSAMRCLAWAGRAIDLASVPELLHEHGLLESAGGAEYLVGIVDDYVAEVQP
jgi:replicative DNA helicase